MTARLSTTQAASRTLITTTQAWQDYGVRPATLRGWARLGLITRAATDERGRALYVAADVARLEHQRVLTLLQRGGWINPLRGYGR